MRIAINKRLIFQSILLTVLCCFSFVGLFATNIQSSPNQIATIENKFGFYLVRSKEITITKIDGIEVVADQKKYELQPGKHTIEFTFYASDANSYGGGTTQFNSKHPCQATFNAEAGHRYQVNGSKDFDTWKGWIDDKTTGKIVANGMFVKKELPIEDNNIKNTVQNIPIVEQPVPKKDNPLSTETSSNETNDLSNESNNKYTFLTRFNGTDVDSVFYTNSGRLIWNSVGLSFNKQGENKIQFTGKSDKKGNKLQIEFHLKRIIETNCYLLSVFFQSSPIIIDFPLAYEASLDGLFGNSAHEERIVEASITKGKDNSYDWKVKIKGEDGKPVGDYFFSAKQLPK